MDAILKIHAKIMDEPLGTQAGRGAARRRDTAPSWSASSVQVRRRSMADENAPGTSKENAEPTGGAQSSAQVSGPDAARGVEPAARRGARADAGPAALRRQRGGRHAAGARPHAPGHVRRQGSGDTSGFGGLRLPGYVPAPAERPFGGWFDAFVDELGAALAERGVGGALQQITIDRGEITFYVAPRAASSSCAGRCATTTACASSCAPRCPAWTTAADVARRLHVVYHLLSMTYRRRIRLEVALDVDDAHVPSVVEVYPTADWHERETWDMFGVVFDGHPALTRILMPDDWEGHPQRKDYPLGGIPVEYKGARDPAARPAAVVLMRSARRADPCCDTTRGGPLMTEIRENARPAEERITTEGPVYTVTGGDWDTLLDSAESPSTTTASSSTWARSTRPRTACCGWCWSWRARPSPRPAR